MKNILVSCALLTFSVTFIATAAFAEDIVRPPQFILLSYDGSYNLDAWHAIRDVSNRQKSAGVDTRFTFFASGVYFLQSSSKTLYQGPRKGPGRSDIGFGGQASEIELRIGQMNQAFSEGNEIGSHANGHFDGTSWTTAEWTSEMNQFENLIFNVFSINKIQPAPTIPTGWLFKKSNIRGFRAPLLGVGPGLYQTLKEKDFSYDCSRTASTDYWPEKLSSGLWNFPLASLIISGTNKRTLSMDYNFYVAQSGAKPDPGNKELYSRQMYDTYLAWFQKNYNGNRAPMNIGHHFSSWNGGAYFSAMNRFALKVCGLPEVKCVTYSEYVKWLESQPANTLASYKAGRFPKAAPVQVAESATSAPNAEVRVGVKADSEGHEFLVALANGHNQNDLTNVTARLSVNGTMSNFSALRVEDFREILEGSTTPVTAHLYNDQGIEIARSTQNVRVDSQATSVSEKALELNAMAGDLPEAHLDERNKFIVPNF
jgi:hypothetical protein